MSAFGRRLAAWIGRVAALSFLTTVAAGAITAGAARFFLPSGPATRTVSVARNGNAVASITVVTQPVATKETGPQATIQSFGEVYVFSPSFIAVPVDEPVQITFWNLQPDDQHDFAIMGDNFQILMDIDLPRLKKTSYIFTFHRPGLLTFLCLSHQPAMSGQILVLGPGAKAER